MTDTNVQIQQENPNEILEHLNCGVAKLAFCELKAQILYANKKFYEMFKHESLEMDVFLNEENYFKYIYNPIYENGECPEHIRFENTFQKKRTEEGLSVGIDGTFQEKIGDQYIYLFTFYDITELKKTFGGGGQQTQSLEEEQISKEPLVDKLTRLWNQTTFPALVNDFLTKGEIHQNSLLLISIEHFIAINDRYGYMFGDAILGEIADSLRNVFGEDNILGRLAGVEFAVFIKGVDRDALRNLAEQFCSAIQGIYVGENAELTMEAKIAITIVAEDDTYTSLLDRCQQVLHQLKNTLGQNYLFDDEQDTDGEIGNFDGDDYLNVASDNMFDSDREQDDIVSFAFNVLEKTTDAKSALNMLLQRIGREFGLHRVSIVEVHEGTRYFVYTYQWAKSVNIINKGQEFRFHKQELEKLIGAYSSDDLLENNGKEFVPFSHRAEETKYAASQMFCALFEGDRYTGHLLLEYFQPDYQWTDEKLSVIKELAKIISSSLSVIRADEASRSKGEFLSRMSHEIRTPMNAICGMTDLLLQNGLTGLNYEYAQTIKTASNNLLKIVNDILDISKIEAGKLEIIPVEYELRTMIEEQIVLINGKITDKPISFYTDIAPDMPKVLYGDETRVNQVVLNLLTNAAKYTEKGFVKLSITYEKTENDDEIELSFSIKDSGIGIRKEDVDKLFAEFQQVDTRRNRKVEGTGLGLAISRQLAELMGGRITVESKYGVGTVFTLTLNQGVHSIEPSINIPDREKLVVLAYEPNKYYRQGMKEMFEKLGIGAVIEEHKEDFIKKLKVGPFTHVFYDYDKIYYDIKDIMKERKEIQYVSMLSASSFRPKEIDEQNHLYVRKPLTIYTAEEILCGEEERNERDKDLQLFVAPDIKILIIDDNPVNLKVAQGLFSSYQCQIDTVTSGLEALELLMEKPEYDILFIDHMMPELDGVETLQLIRSRLGDYGRNVVAVALTANVLKEAQDMFAENGFQGFLAKPIVLRLLHEIMNRFVPEDKKVMIESDEQRRLIGTSISEEDLERIAMKGVDAETGLRCCGNRVDEYIKILKIVAADGKNKVKLLKQYAEEKNYQYYGIEAHAFKSVAASIGAMKQSELAKEHEFAVKDKSYEIVDLNYPKLVNSYQFLLNQIQRVLDKEAERLHNDIEEKTDIDTTRLFEKLEEAVGYLASFKQKKAGKLLEELAGYNMPEHIERAVREAKDKLSLYDDEAAEQLLRDVLQQTQ